MEEPRPGTEAYRVKHEVERRTKLAQQEKLDILFSDTYHESINSYLRHFNKENIKKYIHPAVTGVVESKVQDEKQNNIDIIEFVFDNKNYKITERQWAGYYEGLYLELIVYLQKF